MSNFFKEGKPFRQRRTRKTVECFWLSSLTPRLIAVLMNYKNIPSNCFNSLPLPTHELVQCAFCKFIHTKQIFTQPVNAGATLNIMKYILKFNVCSKVS
jgi:hypothetical protein